MYLLFDIGGTRFRYALSGDGKTLQESVTVPTPKTYGEIVEALEGIQKNLAGGQLRSVGFGIAGSQDKEHTMVLSSKNLPQVQERPLKKDLERIFKAPALLVNDADAAGVGEAVRGAGKGHAIVVYLTISTGVGGARVVGGKLDDSAMGLEPGKQIIDQGKTLEHFVSGGDIQKRYGDPRKIKDEKIWDELARFLALGLHNTIVHWSPDIVVLGGSMILGDPAISLDKVRGYLKEILTVFPKPPPIVKAAFGDSAGLYGALELAKQHV
ncbi:MAG: ROK family protein [bacterium]|nr:ROK family protein [bacterium]